MREMIQKYVPESAYWRHMSYILSQYDGLVKGYEAVAPSDQVRWFLNPLPNDKTLDWSKLKAFLDEKMDVDVNLKSTLGRVDNIVKIQNCDDFY